MFISWGHTIVESIDQEVALKLGPREWVGVSQMEVEGMVRERNILDCVSGFRRSLAIESSERRPVKLQCRG